MSKTINGFSKLTKAEKISWLTQNFSHSNGEMERAFGQWTHHDPAVQKILDGFSENSLANFPLPFSVAPNFVINGKTYAVPMVIEESSVVAAASAAAKFWQERGGFHAEIIGTVKLGQVHFIWKGNAKKLKKIFPKLKKRLISESACLTENMRNRGGGILDIELLDFSKIEPNYYQIRASFDTCDSMGANFINSILEQFADTLEDFFEKSDLLETDERAVEVVMCILSNYTPECLVRAWVECPISSFEAAARKMDMDANMLAERFRMAVRIAEIDPYRATTHNKGIYNGIDAVVLATGNDFRAIEACGHTYACRDGKYRSLSHCKIADGNFYFELKIPLALGTVGGLTALHPLAKLALEILGKPSAQELMQIIACVGLAQNFGAVRSLVTTGIQQGHMKMHLSNILNQLGADEKRAAAATQYFNDKTVSFSAVRDFLVNFPQ